MEFCLSDYLSERGLRCNLGNTSIIDGFSSRERETEEPASRHSIDLDLGEKGKKKMQDILRPRLHNRLVLHRSFVQPEPILCWES